MHAILDWGIQVILWLQGQFSPQWDGLANAVSWLGTTECFLVLAAWLYWCVERRTGARAMVLLYLSHVSNAFTKYGFHQPRPFTYDVRVKPLEVLDDPGLPSGHAQNTLVFWGLLLQVWRTPLVWTLGIVIPILVGLARIYQGVHFPTDVLGGYLLGAGVLWAYLTLEHELLPIFQRWDAGLQSLLSLLVAWLLMLALPAHGLDLSGSLLGVLLGLGVERRALRFSVAGSGRQKGLRLGVGLGITLALRAILAELTSVPLLAFLGYGLIGFWVTAGAPWLFLRLQWAQREATG